MGWTITDPVFQLREATQDTLFELSALPQVDAVIGSAHGSAICLRDPLVSRRHARLTRDGDGWVVHDLESTNGMWVDGMRRASAPLTPGTELRIGGILLVAESARFVALRQRASRILGWSVAQHDEVARALRALRVAASCRTSLILQGDGDLTPIVRQLHVEALGDERPFVVATAKNLRDALERAVGGTLCLPMRRDPAAISVAFEWSGTTSQIVVCVPDARAAGIAASVISSSTRIRIPSLSERRPELARIVAESAKIKIVVA
jgi:pSer/pThr/pTyr-binding forkhead associated (FHA) protein